MTVAGADRLDPVSFNAVLEGDRLTLGPNAAAFLPVTGEVSVKD